MICTKCDRLMVEHTKSYFCLKCEGRVVKLTKDRFSTWEDKNDKDYEIEFDDELIIRIEPNERSKDIADYILSLQEKSDEDKQ